MHAVIVTFDLRGLADEDFRRVAAEVAPAFAEVPGLGFKLWLADADHGTYGGVYLFETAEAADAYLASDLFAGAVTANPRFANAVVRRSSVLEAATAHTARGLRLPIAAEA